MQFRLSMLVLFLTVAAGAWSPSCMPIPLLGWLAVQSLAYYARGSEE